MSEKVYEPWTPSKFSRSGHNPDPITPRPDYTPAPLAPQPVPVASGGKGDKTRK